MVEKKKGVPSSQASSPSTWRRCHHPPCLTRIVEQLPSHARISPGDLCKLPTCLVPFQEYVLTLGESSQWIDPSEGIFEKTKKALKQTD